MMKFNKEQKNMIAEYVLGVSAKAIMEDLDVIWDNKNPDNKKDYRDVNMAIENFVDEMSDCVLELIENEDL